MKPPEHISICPFGERTTAPVRVIIFLVMTMLAFPCFLWAQLSEFIPVPYENGADLDIYASYESDRNKSGRYELQWKDTFLKQKLTLYSNGYVYHPRFIQYHLALAGALKQEYYTATFSEPGWTTDSGIEYNTELFVLPEHPYNLKLFALRIEPLYKEQSATLSQNVQTSKGAIFRYRKKPYFFNSDYIENRLESSTYSTDVNTFSANGTYFQEYTEGRILSFTGDYKHSSFSSSSAMRGHSDEYGAGNTINLKKISLESTLSKDIIDQNSTSGSFGSDQLTWYERLNVFLPLNFKTALTYRYQKNTNTTGAIGTTPERRLADTSKALDFSITHRLYKSLDTTYIVRRDSMTSSTGEINVLSNSLTTNYAKTIPWGMLLAGLNLGRIVTDSSGRTTIVNEPHASIAVPVPGTFVLNSPLADPATISVFLRSPVPPFDLILLTENVHYTVTPFSNTFQITITPPLPPSVPLLPTYDFVVSYTLTTEDFKLQTDVFGWNIRFNLFDNLVNPYYTYSTTDSRVLSGTFGGVPVDSTQNTVGIIIQKFPYRGLAEYQQLDSNISPYRLWRGELNYSGDLTETVRGYATAAYSHKRYPVGTSVEASPGYSEDVTSLSGNVQKLIPEKNLLLSAGGSGSFSRGLTDTNSYSLNATLAWTIGQLVVSMGASAYWSESEGTMGVKTERSHQYYYANIKRKLF